MITRQILNRQEVQIVEAINKFIAVLCDVDADDVNVTLQWHRRPRDVGLFFYIEGAPILFETKLTGGKEWRLLQMFVESHGLVMDTITESLINIYNPVKGLRPVRHRRSNRLR